MSSNLFHPTLDLYLERLVPDRPAVLQAMEERAEASGFPIIGPVAGYFCYQLARIAGARHIFELGSGFGYSTAWFARAVRENGGGVVHHVVWDEKLSREARGYLKQLGYDDLVEYHVAEAVGALSQTPGPFDLIFNDIDKEGYPASLPVIADKLREGGVLIVDNTLWYGRVLDPQENSPSTTSIRQLTRILAASDQWLSTLIPLRDGLTIAYKT